MKSMKRSQYSIVIAALAARVYERMIDAESYKDWASVFAEGTYYEGSWDQGQRIRFMAPTGEGMVSEIAENRPHAFISIRHLGMFANGVEDLTSDAVREWAPAYENYTFETVPEGTRVVVDMDVAEAWVDYMNDSWPKALARLKAICEGE